MRFCSRLPYPTAPRCDANGCYAEIRIEVGIGGAISSMRASRRCATPSAVALGVDSPAPSPQRGVVKGHPSFDAVRPRGAAAPLCERCFARALTSSQPHLLFGAGTDITRFGVRGGAAAKPWLDDTAPQLVNSKRPGSAAGRPGGRATVAVGGVGGSTASGSDCRSPCACSALSVTDLSVNLGHPGPCQVSQEPLQYKFQHRKGHCHRSFSSEST